MPVLSSEDQRMGEYSDSSDIDEEYDYHEEEEEESGWTSYLVDFEIMNQRERELKEKTMSSTDESGGSSYIHSMASDDDVAGSNGGAVAAVWKLIHGGGGSNQLSVAPPPRKLNTIKKNRAERVSDFEDPFEDTATSPHSSPKMDSFMQTKMKGRSDNDKTASPLGKGSRWYFHDQDQEMRSAGNEGRDIDEESCAYDDDDCCMIST